jgi:hypothetical protein
MIRPVSTHEEVAEADDEPRAEDAGPRVLGGRDGLRRPQLARTVVRLKNTRNSDTGVPVIVSKSLYDIQPCPGC